ncbi:MAG: ATP-binding protein [Candidatus Ornithospirochaeta sp.]
MEAYLDTFGSVCIEGPKWCGKTWTSSFHCNSEIFIGDPSGNFQNRKLAEMAPSLILKGEKPRLIDEWQEVPQLWDAVRHEIDQTSGKGQYVLTGSATPNHKGILHSGAGRISKLRMRPMSLFESGDSSGEVSLERLCRKELTPVLTGEVDLLKLIRLIVRGGWPASIHVPEEHASLLAEEYLKAVVDDDVYRIDGIRRNTRKMWLLLHSLARNESTTVSNRTLRKDIKDVDDEDIDVETVQDYLDIFDRLFITDNQPPFATGMRSSTRVKQAAKRHFADPSLACALLKATPSSLLGDLETLGFLFESLCERDLRIYADSFGGNLYHYQDYRGNEIDAVIEMPDGNWCAFEIKLGANQIDAAAENLLNIKKSFDEDPKGKSPSVLCVISGMSNASYKRPDGVYVVPITALKN